MPPKQKGHNARGKKKIFRHAVENVRIGVGHTTIGNVSLQLAAGVPTPENDSSTSQCAFYLELNQQLLSHSSKDFTRFRWEVLELCETREILLLHHREVAEALLARLLDRSTGVYTGHSSTANAKGSTDRGLTLEGYDAFLRLTIAFARDMKSKFLSYFEVFQQAVQAGLFDKNGNVIANAERLQLLYSVQAVWCREMLDFWEDPQYSALVRRIIRIYIKQLRDTKEYIRRLSAELLAFLCRLCRHEILPLIVKEACNEICRDYITFALQSTDNDPENGGLTTREIADIADDDDDDDDSAESDNEGSEEEMEDSQKTFQEGTPSTECPERIWNPLHYQRFVKEELEVHPIIDGLTFYAADLFRGMRGTLSTGMEFFYTHLLQSFGLIHDNPETLSTFVDDLLKEYHTSSNTGRGRVIYLMKEIGSLSIKQALSIVLIETRKQSLKGLDQSSDEEEESEGNKDMGATADRPSHRLLSVVVQSFSPDEFHLHILDALMKTSNYFIWRDEHEDSLLKTVAQTLIRRLRGLEGTTGASTQDVLSLCGATLELLMALCVSPYVTGEFDYGKRQEGKINRPLQVQQLFLSVGKEVISTLSAIAFSKRTSSDSTEATEDVNSWKVNAANADAAQTILLAFVQDVFCKNYCFCLAEERRLHEEQDAADYSGGREEAFEDESSSSISTVKRITRISVKSLLTPLALTLIRSVCITWWETANGVLEHVCQANESIENLFSLHQWITIRRLLERSVLLLRMACDRTMHAKSTPLEQILRLQSVQGKKNKNNIPSGSDSKEISIEQLLHHFLIGVARWFLEVKHRNKAVKRSKSPSRGSHALTQCANEAASELFVCLLPLSSLVLRSLQQQEEALKEWSHLLLQIQNETALESIGTTSYLVHAHVSLSLLRLTSEKSASAAVSSTSRGLTSETQEASIKHLSNTIDLLFNGFESVALQSVGGQMNPGDERNQEWETVYMGLPSSGSDRSQLYRASEIMLEALSVAIQVDERGVVDSLGSGKRLQKLSEAALLLKKHLEPSVQEHLVQILLEALVAPLQSLRVSALQLLHILCHPTLITAEQRLSGLSAVEPFVFSSLLGAECYNPLSHSGNMDGLRSALNPLVSPVERGVISDPLTKIIIGRSMIGMFNLKFSEAWPIAQRVLTELAKTEGIRGGQEEGVVDLQSSKFPFWNAVLCRYARLLTLGGVTETKEVVYDDAIAETSSMEVSVTLEKAEESLSRLVDSYKLYNIRLTDQQRHEKGEMISRAFSSSLYRASRYIVVDLPSRDGEILSWGTHWRAVHLTASSVHSAIYRDATDAATVAKTFLAGLVSMTKNILKPTDHRLRLVEQLLFELSAVYHNDHPSGVSVVLKRIEERLELAMQACSNGPSLVLSNAERQRVPGQLQQNLQRRSSQLAMLCSSYLSDGNSRLQRAAIDNLKRLKVEPFVTHYSKLTPYADNMKSLFTFLAGFHIESEIPVADRPSYISAVLTIALPKFISKVSKEKRRDQAVLQRRILSFLQHMVAPDSEENAPLSLVVTQLLKRLIFTEVQHLDALDMKDLEFMRFWETKVEKDERQCGRYIERLHKKLLSSLRLMESLINAVGMEFGDCVKLTLTLALQAYLVGCKQKLIAPVDQKLRLCEPNVMNQNEEGGDDNEGVKESRRNGRATLSRLRHTINSRIFSTMTAHVRRSAVQVVALLMEQFPEEVMETLQLYVQQSTSVRNSVFGQYIHLLFINSKGATRDAEQSKGAKSSKGYTTPLLRLLRAWLQGPSLLPLIPSFADEVTGTFLEVFALNASAQATGESKLSRHVGHVYKAQTKDIYEALSCVTDILRVSEELVEPLSFADGASGKSKNKSGKKGIKGTLRSLFVMPHFPPIFESLYRLIARGAEDSEASSSGHNASSQKTVMSFSPQLWRELFHTITALTSLTRHASEEEIQKMRNMNEMQEKLLEIAIRFTSHPVCVNDNSTLLVALNELEHLVDALPHIHEERHYYPILKLFNALPTPMARIQLSRIFQMVVTKIPLYRTAAPQLDAVARAVKCLNSFDEDNTALDRYDFDLRFHTFNSLQKFFLNDGNYGALSGSNRRDEMQDEAAAVQKNHVRKEREYVGELDVTLPLDKKAYPVLLVEGISILAANTMFFLRDTESTIRTFARHLLHAIVQYASRIKEETTKQDVLERVVRRIVLPSLRRGVVARDVHIRAEHMSSFGALGKFFPSVFPSFAQLHSPNSEENFFLNVCHVQPKARLNALSILRRQAEKVHVRDMLRVFIPFLMSAVKDFAQGKRDLQNLTEGKAKGYCDAVLMTIASISHNLPWMAYHRVLSLLLTNAGSNPDLRLPMLRGVVQVLDHFHYLDEGKTLRKTDVHIEKIDEDSDEDARDEEIDDREDGNEEERVKYYHARIIQALEREILPQLLEFICDAKTRRGLGIQDNLSGQHNISTLRREEEKKNKAATKNSIIQLPVAIAVTKIVKKLPEAQCNEYMDMLLDEVISKLRTKNDKQRESARRILGVMLQEAGPGKLQYVIKKLKGHLVHGYQLHVLGYTMVTLLYQLYEPNNVLLQSDRSGSRQFAEAEDKREGETDVIQDALNLMNSNTAPDKKRHRTDTGNRSENHQSRAHDIGNLSPTSVDADTLIGLAEEELVRQLVPASSLFDPAYGVECLTAALDDLLLIFLDDYLGEIGHQKEQIELMSKMVEIKRNRSLQGFNLLARHADAEKMMSMFIKRVSWVLTPPSESEAMALSNTEGSAHVRTLIKAEIQKKYTTVGKAATADIIFVKKVRALSLAVAKNFLINPTLKVDQALDQVRSLLGKHNQVREERIQAFEAKDGTRRVRGNSHLLIQSAPRTTLKEQQDKNFLLAPEPERVDVDFSAHTVLTTQQKQKLKVYKGRYAKELQQASKDFYREDATTAVVLDTLDEFLLRLLLSMLRKVLGIGRDKHRHSVVELDLLRRKRRKNVNEEAEEEEEEEEAEVAEDGNVNDQEEKDEDDETDDEEEEQEEHLNPTAIDEDKDDLEHFASAANEGMNSPSGNVNSNTANNNNPVNLISDLNVEFTREHRDMLENILIVVLTTLEGEGSDAVVAHALDVVLALVSLRPPLDVARENDRLLQTVVMYFERGGPIKQRAMRVCAGIISHQRFHLSMEEAKRMVTIIRGEVIDRTEYLPMALSLLYAILGKHIALVEIYDLIDLLTELLVHLSGKRFIRTRSILSVVRFLTEYKLTPQKFRSHVDLICRNLDFPEMGGRLALLDLIDALLVRLPTVVIRQEAPVFLIPLAALTSQGEYQQDRKRAGEVLQTLAKHAGIDVLAPELQGWIDPSKDRPMRTMGMQAIALCMKTLQTVYGPTVESDEESSETFVGSVMWCIPYVMEACRYIPRKSEVDSKKKNKKEEAKKKGWSLIFYALRAVESIVYTLPQHFYPMMAPQLMPLIVEHLLLHPHAWVRGVCFRLLNHYCYNFVESNCHFLQDSIPVEQTDETKENEELSAQTEGNQPLPLFYYSSGSQALIQYISPVLKRLLTVVERSDIDKEKYDANIAIDDPSRSELLKSMIYLSKAFLQCCAAHFVREKGSASSKDFISKQFDGLHRHIRSIASPILKQGSIVNYVVRTATLIQFLGGYVGVLPRGGVDQRTTSTSDEEYGYHQACTWLLTKGSQILSLVKDVSAPLVNMAIGASVLSHRLSTLAYQSLKVIQQQLEERRSLLVAPLEEGAARKGKRSRENEEEMSVDLDTVLAVLVEKESATYQEKQVKRIRTEVRKNLKKNQHEVSKALKGRKRERSK